MSRERGPGPDDLTIGIDIGGTKVAAGVVTPDGEILAHEECATPSSSSAQVVDAVRDATRQLAAAVAPRRVAGIGVGAAGFIDAARATVLFAPNLAWRDEPLKKRIAEATGLPTVVENDANAMAWGEFRFGAGVGAADLVCVTVGTGLGGGVVLDGRLHRGSYGIAAEVGHLRVIPDGRRCGCGNRGCWEQYCSGRALVREARDIALLEPAYGARLLELAGDGEIEGTHVTAAAREGDPAALECFAQVGRWLGQGLADLAAVLDPERFVVGGGVIAAGDLLLGPARTAYAEALTGGGHRPVAEIVPAALGPAAGLVGAADLARMR